MQGQFIPSGALNDDDLRDIHDFLQITYPVVRLSQEYVYKVNAILLGSMEESVTFRSPASMLRSLRKFQVLRKTFNRTLGVVPPKMRNPGSREFSITMTKFPAEIRHQFEKAIREIVCQGQVAKAMFGSWILELDLERVKPLQQALWKEVNRTHSCNEQDGNLDQSKSRDKWQLIETDQPKRLSWRRSGRKA